MASLTVWSRSIGDACFMIVISGTERICIKVIPLNLYVKHIISSVLFIFHSKRYLSMASLKCSWNL